MKAHLGAEITGADGDSYPLLAENRIGYRNLCRLMTSMKLRAPEASASLEELTQFSEGLVCFPKLREAGGIFGSPGDSRAKSGW